MAKGYLNWDGIEARAIYCQGEMVMLKGNQLRRKTVPSAKPERRKKALNDICQEVKGELILTNDTPFSSPSYAAWIASGTGLNGWDF